MEYIVHFIIILKLHILKIVLGVQFCFRRFSTFKALLYNILYTNYNNNILYTNCIIYYIPIYW